MTESCGYRWLLIASSFWVAHQSVSSAQFEFGDTPPPLQPRTSANESERDRQAAATYYAHARLLELQDNRADALRRYQRAWRYDKEAASILKHIVPLAQSLDRPHEAARYAILAAERFPDNADLLVRLGLYLVEQGDTRRAIPLFEKARELRKDDPPDSKLVSLHTELGRFHLAREDFARAVERFAYVREALDEPKEHGLEESTIERLLAQQIQLFAVMGEAYLRAGDADTAATLFQKEYTEQREQAVLSFHLARVAKARGEAKTAEEHLEAYFAAKQSYEGTSPYDLLAAITLLKQPDPAIAAQAVLEKLQKLHTEDPDNTALRYSLAQRLSEQERHPEARDHYLELLESSATAVAYQRLTELSARTADADLLLRVATKATKETSSIDILQANGEPLARKELLAAAVKLAQQRLADEGTATDASLATAAALLAVECDDLDATRSMLAASLTRQELAADTVREAIGLSLFTRGHYAFAAEVFQAAIREETDAERAQFYYYLSGALEMAGQTNEALQAAEEGAKLRQDVAILQMRAAWVLYHAKRHEQAHNRYLALLKRYDADNALASRETARDIRYLLANICTSRNLFREAEEWLEQILDEFPHNSSALNDLGYLWADRGEHLERALRMTEIAVDAEPDSIAYRDSLGWAYYRLGRFRDAVRELEHATQGSAPDGVILDHLGDAYRSAGSVERALETWQRARRAFSEAKDADAVQRVTLKIEKQLLQ